MYLADSSIAGIGAKGAAALLNRYGPIEEFPSQELGDRQRLAVLFKELATLRTDANLFADVNELEWHGPTADFPDVCEWLEAPDLLARAERAAHNLVSPTDR